ncbi:6-carboxytetrahydropterin synthase QueD [Desulfobacca acetoxidans]|uniref:6-carboxy-5,6,7,8-tetrahydropterin synthase n=1 Tax=Desulfobacca acetoxidans (strain ATCC 700848 / DSM 11109 / ASRB2) TaxID=880072 RepID=F2NGH8_DESAR|nr:6-carboxytetrahydropterin synthase QueD [Desulfobacca acetoxidans]AEB08591.1 queuosine biosynthesis protein QueD [Desulfobacca acetoxidans DSM 11109]
MYELKVITQFAAAHRLDNFYGKCEALHGHNWKVEIFLRADGLDEAGLVMDFGKIKSRAHEILSEIDHTFLNELPAFKTQNPSSENIARYLFERLGAAINNDRVTVSRISVWESDNTSASYFLAG